MSCPVCRSNEGLARISPGPPVHEGRHWVVEHAYPSSLLGWLVIVLRRHAEALHELSREEGEELGALQWAVSKALAAETSCMKEYSAFFAEAPGFQHVHVHMVPRSTDLSPDLRGGQVFAFLRVPEGEAVAKEEIADFCSRASAEMSRLLHVPASDTDPAGRGGLR